MEDGRCAGMRGPGRCIRRRKSRIQEDNKKEKKIKISESQKGKRNGENRISVKKMDKSPSSSVCWYTEKITPIRFETQKLNTVPRIEPYKPRSMVAPFDYRLQEFFIDQKALETPRS
jgi:hypothetical protein